MYDHRQWWRYGSGGGVSLAMKGMPEGILRINALGTVYINQEFFKAMNVAA